MADPSQHTNNTTIIFAIISALISTISILLAWIFKKILQDVEKKIDDLDEKFEKHIERIDLKLDKQCEKCVNSILVRSELAHLVEQINDLKIEIREVKDGRHER